MKNPSQKLGKGSLGPATATGTVAGTGDGDWNLLMLRTASQEIQVGT